MWWQVEELQLLSQEFELGRLVLSEWLNDLGYDKGSKRSQSGGKWQFTGFPDKVR